MGQRSGNQIFGEGHWRLLSPSFAPQGPKFLDAEPRKAINVGVEISDNYGRRSPTSD